MSEPFFEPGMRAILKNGICVFGKFIAAIVAAGQDVDTRLDTLAEDLIIEIEKLTDVKQEAEAQEGEQTAGADA